MKLRLELAGLPQESLLRKHKISSTRRLFVMRLKSNYGVLYQPYRLLS